MDGSQELFDSNWDTRDAHESSSAYWADKGSMPALLVLKKLCGAGSNVEFAIESSGVLLCRIPDQNIAVNMLDPSGICSRRGEAYSIGDVILLLCIRRTDYSYSSITQRGFKYVNVLERDRIKSILTDPDTVPELLEAKVRYTVLNGDLGNVGPSDPDEEDTKLPVQQDKCKRSVSEVLTMVDGWRTDFMGTCAEEGSDIYKVARKKYRNLCVFAATVLDRPLRTRISLLAAHGEGFERVLQKLDSVESLKSEPQSRPAKKLVANVLRPQHKMRVLDEICSKYRKKPVIIVPSSSMSLLCRQNIKQLLEDHQFVDAQESVRTGGPVTSTLPMNAVEVVHNICGRAIKFRVVESSYTSKFTTSDWISVVCVVLNVKGGQWQFKGYPFESLVDIFVTMKGVLFTYDTDSVPAEMSNWDVKVLRINRSHRHHDASIAKEFWEYLESFLLQPRQRKIHSSKRLS
ncbi:hypothetical protein BBOV_II002840 [Babesia bovis T2Bo]|uniref:Cell division control protein 73 C-terminal domain-containing protein n=1 Tax=Babesia bovis TaxID=5865 RepID=A7ATH8_BABBO|nr:hypothetical protein BBOV_II002840 [Babesia bovis T2Bo]EDO06239.1 hypothetical protein BBOV_II002840 [Babesia bovis T2Bo]|eukprot:XP_001609807.1 hypothetical protein [Babesia bovis T2Bo]